MRAHEQWRGNTGGTAWMHQMLIRIFRHIDLRPMYAFMALFVVPGYMLFSRKSYTAIYHYFRQRHGFGRWKAFRMTYLNHYRFGQIILDRFAVYAGQKFHFDIDGNDEFLSLLHGEEGFLILSCHVGNYELAGYTFQSTGKRYNALVFSGEAAAVMENRRRLLEAHNIGMIPVSNDMSHIFAMNNALADGEIVSIPGDRIFGSPRSVECEFLGSKAKLPLGPYIMAAQREVPVLAIFVMKEATYRYQVYIRRLNPSADAAQAPLKQRASQLAQLFASEMETVLQRYPEQWFNYYEYWNQ